MEKILRSFSTVPLAKKTREINRVIFSEVQSVPLGHLNIPQMVPVFNFFNINMLSFTIFLNLFISGVSL
jgi:hypothetical protein